RLHLEDEQRPAEIVQAVPFGDDARRWTLKGLQVVERDVHVLEAKRFERLKAEDVANDRSREVGNRTFLEEVEVIGDIREPLTGRAGYRLDLVGLRSVVFTIGKTICPDYRPGSSGGFARDGRSCFLGIHAVLRR